MPQSLADELSSIPMSPNLGQSLERAHRVAREQAHKAVTLEHLLLALTEDTEAALILQSANIELARLSTDVSGYLGRLLEDMRSDGTSEPRPDADLLRVMQAAASAAKQSRRRQIDGAIVLAAVVGDGKSPAAGMLKALGMTFEEAIRALQRANTKARLKPTPRPAEAAPSPARASAEPAASPAPEPAPPLPAAAAPEAPPSPPVATAAGVSQSAEEILAAARARIQQRAVSASPRIETQRREDKRRSELPPTGPQPAPDADTPPPGPADAAAADALTEAIEAAMSGSPARTAEPAPPPAEPTPAATRPTPPPVTPPAPSPAAQAIPPAPPIAQPGHPTRAPWGPPTSPEAPRPGPGPSLGPSLPPSPAPAQRQPSPPPAPPIAARPLPPLPARLIAPGEGPRRPPPPPSAAPQPPAGFPNRPPRAPWPAPGEHHAAARASLANGSYTGAPPAPSGPSAAAARAPQPMPPSSPQRGPAHADKGLLIESVPRRMRIGVPATAEVRIARDRIEALIATLSTRGSQPLTERPLMRALSVRLRAPGADFWIEPAAPETQWVDSASSLIHDDYAAWRWTVVARRRGRGRLTLMVSARTVGRDGVAAETAPPDRAIEVRVGANWGQAARRWVGWMLAVLAGTVIGYFSEPIQILVGHFMQRGL